MTAEGPCLEALPEASHAGVLLCPACGHPLSFAGLERRCCNHPDGSALSPPLLEYEPAAHDTPAEVVVRDRQAPNYLTHAKFGAQIPRIHEFIRHAVRRAGDGPVLDLGCGPGPTTKALLEAGYGVVAIDFSRASLIHNRESCAGLNRSALFVRADLNRIAFRCESVSGLMMSDFLQHLGGYDAQRAFLDKAFTALKPGGWFFLSFLNANLKSRLWSGIDGSFAGGAIRYHRIGMRERKSLLPPSAIVSRSVPLNIFHAPGLDRLASRVPLAQHLARWILVTGRKAEAR